MTTILLIDPNPICRNALQQVIEHQTQWKVCGQANDLEAGLKLMAARKPSLVVIDPFFSPITPLTFIKSIWKSYPETKIVIFAAIKNNILTQRMIDVGAHAFISKQTESREVIDTLQRVVRGEICIVPAFPKCGTDNAIASGDYQAIGQVNILSGREWEVFRAIGRGQSTRQIAEQMKLSIKTIESHRAHIKEKLNLENNLALVQAAAQWTDGSDG